jgi:hypothetical protein
MGTPKVDVDLNQQSKADIDQPTAILASMPKGIAGFF